MNATYSLSLNCQLCVIAANFSRFFFQEWKSYLLKLPRNRFTFFLCVTEWRKTWQFMQSHLANVPCVRIFFALWEWKMGILLHFIIFKFRRLHAQLAHWMYESDFNICKWSHFYFCFFFTLCVPYLSFSWRRKSTKDFCWKECTSMNMITFNMCAWFESAKSVTDFLVHSLLG